jgi:hypothetical protein
MLEGETQTNYEAHSLIAKAPNQVQLSSTSSPRYSFYAINVTGVELILIDKKRYHQMGAVRSMIQTIM